MRKIIIAIDGLSSCGKSSFAKILAKKYGFTFIDTGAMYRAVTLCALRNGYIAEDKIDIESVIALLPSLVITLSPNSVEGNNVFVNGEDVTPFIRSMEVSRYVSHISGIYEVRARMVALQQAMGKERGVVMDGRDIGSVVFPDAELKIFMTATPEIRAERRYKELKEKGVDVSLEEIKSNLLERDNLDQTRTESPLVMAEDAQILDNSYMTIDEQVRWVDNILGL